MLSFVQLLYLCWVQNQINKIEISSSCTMIYYEWGMMESLCNMVALLLHILDIEFISFIYFFSSFFFFFFFIHHFILQKCWMNDVIN